MENFHWRAVNGLNPFDGIALPPETEFAIIWNSRSSSRMEYLNSVEIKQKLSRFVYTRIRLFAVSFRIRITYIVHE